MSNLTILEQNTLLGFEHEDTQALYLRGAARNERKAFWMACQWQDYLRPFMTTAKGFNLYSGNAVDEVTDFIRERHFRTYFPNQ